MTAWDRRHRPFVYRPQIDLRADEVDEIQRIVAAGVWPKEDAAHALAILQGLHDDRTTQRMGLSEFSEEAWKIVEPTTVYKHNWHIDAIDEHLEAWVNGEIRNFLLNMPPRHEKSLKCAVFLPAWVWTFWPSFRWLFSSYAQDLSIRDSRKTRSIIESAWYQERWGHLVQLTGDQNAKMRFENTATGYRIASSVEGIGTGEGGDGIVVDDPHNVKEGESEAKRESVLVFWDRVMSTRLNDPKTGRKMIVMQRIHERDLSGHVLAQGGYVHLMLPTEYDPRRMVQQPGRYTTDPDPIPTRDPRKKPGELMWPDHFGPAEVKEAKIRLGSYGFAGQHQQRPSPAEGGIFKKVWWRYWQPVGTNYGPVTIELADGSLKIIEPITLPKLEQFYQSWDMAFKDQKSNSMVCGGAFGRRVAAKAQAFLLEFFLEHTDFLGSLQAMRDFATPQLHPYGARATAKYVEDKANGPAIISTLRTEIPGIIPVDPEGDKVGRARAVSPFVEAGNVFLPHPKHAPWVDRFIDSTADFPNGAITDDTDMLSQALRKILGVQPDTTSYVVATPKYS